MISDTGQVPIPGTFEYITLYSRYISLLHMPDLKSTLCQADNTRSEPLLAWEDAITLWVQELCRIIQGRHMASSQAVKRLNPIKFPSHKSCP